MAFDSVGGNLIIKGPYEPIPIRGVQTKLIQAYVAEALRVQTITPTGAAATYFGLQINGYDIRTGERRTETITYTSVGATDLEVSTAMIADITALKNFSVTATANGNNFDLTAISPNPKFSTASVGVGVLTLGVASPAGTTGYGLGSLILATQTFQSSDIVAANQYTTVNIQSKIQNETGGARPSAALSQTVLYVNQGDADYTSLVGTYGVITQAFASKKATWATAGGNASVTNGVGTLGGADVFYGNSDTNIGLQAGDVIIIGGVGYPIASILSATTWATYGVPNDAAAAATSYVQLRELPLS